MKEQRRVLTSRGYETITVDTSPKENTTVKESKPNLEKNSKPVSAEVVEEVKDITVTADLINAMELSELKILAENNKIKLGNRKQDSARKFLIKALIPTSDEDIL